MYLAQYRNRCINAKINYQIRKVLSNAKSFYPLRKCTIIQHQTHVLGVKHVLNKTEVVLFNAIMCNPLSNVYQCYPSQKHFSDWCFRSDPRHQWFRRVSLVVMQIPTDMMQYTITKLLCRNDRIESIFITPSSLVAELILIKHRMIMYVITVWVD